MPYRRFHDAAGVEWQVWEVHPTLAERRVLRERRTPVRLDRVRRQHDAPRVGVHRDLVEGWLAFRSESERRRLAPIPADWLHRSESGLQDLLALAQSTGRFRRLIE